MFRSIDTLAYMVLSVNNTAPIPMSLVKLAKLIKHIGSHLKLCEVVPGLGDCLVTQGMCKCSRILGSIAWMASNKALSRCYTVIVV